MVKESSLLPAGLDIMKVIKLKIILLTEFYNRTSGCRK